MRSTADSRSLAASVAIPVSPARSMGGIHRSNASTISSKASSRSDMWIASLCVRARDSAPSAYTRVSPDAHRSIVTRSCCRVSIGVVQPIDLSESVGRNSSHPSHLPSPRSRAIARARKIPRASDTVSESCNITSVISIRSDSQRKLRALDHPKKKPDQCRCRADQQRQCPYQGRGYQEIRCHLPRTSEPGADDDGTRERRHLYPP